MSLAALQNDFRAWLTTGSDDIGARFAPDAQAGLLVYQNNYRSTLMACLEASFPQTGAWIGEPAFHSVAAALIDTRPPDSWSLDHYAAHFPAALADLLPDDPEVSELATLEFALTDAFVGADAATLTTSQLPHIDWDAAVLQLVPAARLLTATTNATAIWSALSSEVEPPSAAFLPTPAGLLVWRVAYTSCFRLMEETESAFMHELTQGLRFADVCEQLVASLGENDGINTAGALLARWAADGLLREPAMIA